MSDPAPKLSVVIITYNHEAYIEQTVRSALTQQTEFDYEVIIAEDCSTDRTREICIGLQKAHPDRIRLILQPARAGMIANFVAALEKVRGRYLALLDGDDYWTSPHKLQCQVDYMDARPECRICYHAASVMDDPAPHEAGVIAPATALDVDLAGWLKNRSMYNTGLQTSSVVARWPDGPLPAWFHDLKAAGDWPLIVWLLLQGGVITFLDEPEPMSVYRRRAGSITHADVETASIVARWKQFDVLHDVLLVSRNLDGSLAGYLHPTLASVHMQLAARYLSANESGKARWHAWKACSYTPLSTASVAWTAQILLRSYSGAYRRLRQIKRRLSRQRRG